MTAAEFIYTVLLKPPILRRGANFVLTSILPRTIKVKGAIIHLNPLDPVVSGALTFRSYEKEEIEFFVRLFEPGMTLVDVGANVGLYTGLALHISPEARILCVEPDSGSRVYLEKTIESNLRKGRRNNVTVCGAAASDARGEIILYKNSQNKGDNRIYADPLCNDREVIKSETLDCLCEAAGLVSIDFLKVDVQGAELNVLSGARQILGRSTDCIILTEFWPYGLRRCGFAPEHYLLLMQELGFRLYELRGGTLREIDDFGAIISESPGRMYRNLVGLKGRFVSAFRGAPVRFRQALKPWSN